MKQDVIYITGHQHPDTDSIVAAIGFTQYRIEREEVQWFETQFQHETELQSAYQSHLYLFKVFVGQFQHVFRL